MRGSNRSGRRPEPTTGSSLTCTTTWPDWPTHASGTRRPSATRAKRCRCATRPAAALAALHNFDEARLQLNHALASCTAARPPRRYEVAVQLHNLAALDQACGQPQRSEQLYRRALAIKHDLLGPDHPEVALIANNLGTLLHQQYRTAEAADLFRQALTIAEQSYPPGHPTTTGILRNLDAPG